MVVIICQPCLSACAVMKMVGKIVSTFNLIILLLFSKVISKYPPTLISDFFLLQDSCRPLFRQINGLDFLTALTRSLLFNDRWTIKILLFQPMQAYKQHTYLVENKLLVLFFGFYFCYLSSSKTNIWYSPFLFPFLFLSKRHILIILISADKKKPTNNHIGKWKSMSINLDHWWVWKLLSKKLYIIYIAISSSSMNTRANEPRATLLQPLRPLLLSIIKKEKKK